MCCGERVIASAVALVCGQPPPLRNGGGGRARADCGSNIPESAFWRNEPTVQKRNRAPPRGAVRCTPRAGPCIFPCYVQGRVVFRWQCIPERCGIHFGRTKPRV